VGEAAIERVVAGKRSQPLVVSALPEGHMPVRSDRVFSGGPKAALPPGLAAAWNVAPPSNLLDVCPDLKARLPSGWRYATPEEERSIAKPDIRVFGAPIVRGDRALIETGVNCRGLCGSRLVELYRLEQGRWRFVAISAASIS
jgi:hypothetical protein